MSVACIGPAGEFTRARACRPGAPLRVGAAMLAMLAVFPVAADEAHDAAMVKAAIGAACEMGEEDIQPVSTALGGAVELTRSPIKVRGRAVGWRHKLMLPSGARVQLERFTLGGELRRVIASSAASPARRRRPHLVAVADGRCKIVTGRRLRYYPDGSMRAVERLASNLDDVVASEPLNPPVPPGPGGEGVPVALVDSGVNYLLEHIHRRLARDSEGAILGFDYWDMDPRPFDAHPSRSAFYPQRHGTQTAGVLLAEAPVARLIPLRYPRGNMQRMRALVDRTASLGVIVVNLSMGSERRADWVAFEAAARRHPEMLFVVSAGNNGRDIDAQPLYPAALALENLIVVTSSDSSGLPARGSNWGRESVHLAVPAESLLVRDFHGRPKLVSGSSYAAARVSAMAACMLSQHPGWRAPELRAAILARAEKPVDDAFAFVSGGVIRAPTEVARGGCPAEQSAFESTPEIVWTQADLYASAALPPHTHLLRPTLVILNDSNWDLLRVYRAVRRAAAILAQCGVAIPEASVRVLDAPRRFRFLRDEWGMQLVARSEFNKPTVYFLEDTAQATPFDAETIGRSNSKRRPSLIDTIWITAAIPHPGIGLAHEFYHLLADSGRHNDDPGNLMHERSSGRNTLLHDWQCTRALNVGEAFGNLERAE